MNCYTHKLGIAHLAGYLGLLAIFELIYQLLKLRKPIAFDNTDKTMTLDEFENRIKNGQKLVILDDLVLNVAKFRFYHPGGKFSLDHNVGRDISKFFYGGYVLENKSIMRKHTHSNTARTIVNSLIIAKIEKSQAVTAKF